MQATIVTTTRDGIEWRWEVLFRKSGEPFTAVLNCVCWRRYATPDGARRAAIRAIEKLGIDCEIEPPFRPVKKEAAECKS